MMSDELIKQESQLIRERLRGSMVYGLPLDMQNADAMLAAAYQLGRQDAVAELRKPIEAGPPSSPRTNRARTLEQE